MDFNFFFRQLRPNFREISGDRTPKQVTTLNNNDDDGDDDDGDDDGDDDDGDDDDVFTVEGVDEGLLSGDEDPVDLPIGPEVGVGFNIFFPKKKKKIPLKNLY